jgi:adenosylcobinamide kinase/adenosylcobinamide-phosphate guanylyltransferase
MSRSLIFGGARSGKSAYAEQLALRLSAEGGKQVIYLATAAAADSEMQQRIVHHQSRRPADWQTIEQTTALGAAIQEYSQPGTVLLIDCLTVWLSNLLFSENVEFPEIGQITPPALFAEQRGEMLNALEQAKGDVIWCRMK